MKLRLGKNTGGRLQGQARKNVLLSFVASSEKDELHIFLDLVFQSFLHFISGLYFRHFFLYNCFVQTLDSRVVGMSVLVCRLKYSIHMNKVFLLDLSSYDPGGQDPSYLYQIPKIKPTYN